MVQGLLNSIVLSQNDRDNQDTSECFTIPTDNVHGEEIKSISSSVANESVVKDCSKQNVATIFEKEEDLKPTNPEYLTSDDDDEMNKGKNATRQEGLARSFRVHRRLKTVTSVHNRSNKPRSISRSVSKFWLSMIAPAHKDGHDLYHDGHETHRTVFEVGGSDNITLPETQIYISRLRECQESLHNQEKEDYRHRASNPFYRFRSSILNICAALYLYIVNTLCFETMLVTVNAMVATFFFCEYADDYAVKLDFSFLAFSIIFPLTFLIQSTYSRRDQALARLADYRSAIISTALYTLTVDWPSSTNSNIGGRLDLPENFDEAVVNDCRQLVKLTYQYLSMPSVAHGRNLVFRCEQETTKRVRAIQNNIVKQMNDLMYDFYLHAEIMRKHGFPSGEISRLTQFHQYLQQRFDQLRYLKYYRTPLSTRSIGRAFIFFLPWLNGPYFAHVYESTNYTFIMILAVFTYLVLLGLLNTQIGLEDPFVSDFVSWTPGVDTVKLDYELASLLQALEQHFAQSKMQRSFNLARLKKNKKNSNV